MPDSNPAYRDIEVPDRSESPDAARPPGRRVVVTIGIDLYLKWPILQNAANDARAAHAMFTALGFEPHAPPILDEAATGQALRALVTDGLSTLGPADSLVLFFAGHGHTHSQTFEDGVTHTAGYLIPVDGQRPGTAASSWLRADEWLRQIARLPPRHILVILDACYSGIVLGSLFRERGMELLEHGDGALTRRRSRRVITSALHGQLAMDSGPIPYHSLFTGHLLRGLETGFGDAARMLTGSELALGVQRRVREASRSTQTPDFGSFELDARGEMVIPVLAGARTAAVPPPAGSQPPWQPPPGTRRSGSLVRRVAVIGDYLDGRANARTDPRIPSMLVTGMALAVLVWLTQAPQFHTSLLGELGGHLAWLSLPALLAGFCLHIVCARNVLALQYRYVQAVRHLAKLLAVLALPLLANRVASAGPMLDETAAAGYICDDRGKPFTEAIARLVDATGRPASERDRADRAGYVWLPVTAWSFRPLAIEVERPGCEVFRLSLEAPAAEGCEAAEGIVRADSEGRRLPVWRIQSCEH